MVSMSQPPVAVIEFATPFVVFLGDITAETYAKTGVGLIQWRPGECVGQMRLSSSTFDAGVPDVTAVAATAAGARSLIIGSAAVGGVVPAGWVPALCEAARAGLDIVAGMHGRLAALPGLAEAAAEGGARLIDVRVPPPGLPVGTGRKRTGRRVLTVGTDCACGKKYTALQLTADLNRAGVDATFRATGQTGIMIAGRGVPIDAVVSDFVTGAAEVLSPDAPAHHWDVIEGQGGLFHPGYLQVTVGLLVGSQPDAFVVCHDPLRTHIMSWPDFALPGVADEIERTVLIGRLTNPRIRCVGVSLNTSKIPAGERARLLARYAEESGVPCVDPLIDGTGAIVAEIRRRFSG